MLVKRVLQCVPVSFHKISLGSVDLPESFYILQNLLEGGVNL
jgi:hypothetical protein